MAYRRPQRSIREAYEERFPAREMPVQRVVNIVEKRSMMTRPEVEYDRRYDDDQWYGGSRSSQDAREYRGEGTYSSSDHGYRHSSPTVNEDPYYHSSSRDYGHLRRHVEIRNSDRGGHHFRNRGRGSAPPMRSDRRDHKLMPPLPYPDRGEDHDDYRRREPYASARDRSPLRREPHITLRAGSNTSRYEDMCGPNTSLDKPSVPVGHTSNDSVEGSPHSSASSKEKNPASPAVLQEVVAASTDPKLTPEEDFKARRAQAIAGKALEIETLYRQDCETFGTVVNMLVAKEPSLDKLLQAPLKEILLEIKQRCLDDLRHFIVELDHIIQQPEAPV
uniref:Periphilin 1 n=1 Tax=Myripristis murdjan TaxID=586833 RepID=A0A667WBN8_9TELE